MSSARLASTASFQAGRMIGVALPAWIACNCDTRSGISLGECSVSSRIPSNPESARIQAATVLAPPSWRDHTAGDRAGQPQMAGLERGAHGAELVGEPGDAERRMAEHA